MKRILQSTLLVLVLFYCSGCLWTFHPIYKKEDVLYLNTLPGMYNTGYNKNLVITNLAVSGVKLSGTVNEIKQKGYLFAYFDDEQKPLEEYAVS